MEFSKVVETRRSIREYIDKKVDKSVVEEILRTAQQAPSWKNSQTARYYVVMSDEKLRAIKEKCLPEMNRKRAENAPVLIVTAFETKHSGFDKDKNPEDELGDQWGAYDLGLQNENLVLKAAELGLGTLIMGIRDIKAIREVLNIPESQNIMAVIALGYQNIYPEGPKRKDLSEITKFV